MPRRSESHAGTSMAVPLIARNLSRLLKKAGVPGKELAQRLQVSQQAVSQWVSGRLAPTRERLGQIAEALNVEVDELTRDTRSADTLQIKRYTIDLSPQNSAGGRLEEDPIFYVSSDVIEAVRSEFRNSAAIEVKDNNLEPSVRAGELLFVDMSWRAITLSDLYFLDFAGLPVFRWCHIVVPGIANVSDHRMERDVPVSDLAVLGRVVGRFGAGPVRKQAQPRIAHVSGNAN